MVGFIKMARFWFVFFAEAELTSLTTRRLDKHRPGMSLKADRSDTERDTERLSPGKIAKTAVFLAARKNAWGAPAGPTGPPQVLASAFESFFGFSIPTMLYSCFLLGSMCLTPFSTRSCFSFNMLVMSSNSVVDLAVVSALA